MPDATTFPAYAYVPGHRPHPTRDERGHSYGLAEPNPPAFDPDDPGRSPTFSRALALFDRGYYWEAHEAWEALWISVGRAGEAGELLRGLIKLAAAGVKLRQARPDSARTLAAQSAEHFRAAGRVRERAGVAGLCA